jgi:hypothetical protein
MLIAITTACREQPTLLRTLDSLSSSGWSNQLIFAEPNANTEGCKAPVRRRKVLFGAWRNWLTALTELRAARKQDWYGVIQDDVIFCRGTYDYIRGLENLPGDLGLISLFTPPVYSKSKPWTRVDDGCTLFDAQCFFFPAHCVDSLIACQELWQLPGNKQIDNRVGLWLKMYGLAAYYHSPSLCQHIGETSTLWPEAKIVGDRMATDFIGEDSDCRDL